MWKKSLVVLKQFRSDHFLNIAIPWFIPSCCRAEGGEDVRLRKSRGVRATGADGVLCTCRLDATLVHLLGSTSSTADDCSDSNLHRRSGVECPPR